MIMILYFSGTGNSRYVAQIINSEIADKLVSINEYLQNNQLIKVDDELIVVVCPTYAWRIPRVVETFIKNSEFKINSKIYFVMTCGSGIANASKYLVQLSKQKHLAYMGLAKVVMPENFITMFKAPDDPQKIIARSVGFVLELAQIIKAEQYFGETKVSIIDRFLSSLVNRIFYPLFVKAKGFYVNDKCIGCGQCVKLCPLNNLKMVQGKPVWSNQCTQCMACIGGCAKQAIEYRNKTQNKQRYYLHDNYQKR